MDAVRQMLQWPMGRGSQPQYRLHVITGDRRGAGTDANVYVVLHDVHGTTSSPLQVNKVFKNDNERGSSTTVDVWPEEGLRGAIVKVEVSRDNFADMKVLGVLSGKIFGHKSKRGSANWFLDRIEVEEVPQHDNNMTMPNGLPEPAEPQEPVTVHRAEEGGRVWVFPLQRWVAAHRTYTIHLHDTFLPQYDPQPERRYTDINDKQQEYNYEQKVPGGPAQIESLPSDEKFSEEYFWTFSKEKIKLLGQSKMAEWTTDSKWKTFENMKKIYSKSLEEPKCLKVWREDWWFGLQRLQGVNPMLITLCKTIPSKLAVTDEIVDGLLEGHSLSQALENNKIFFCDLEITDGISSGKEDNHVEFPSPIALFYLNKNNQLMPIAIQLKQEPGADNPVYTPKDDQGNSNTWLVAKMFYNNAEAQHHQALTHLGLTHLLMEGVVICTHRNLSPSHPLFKLMAPHFLFLLAINSRGLEKLVSAGGWVDCCMTQGLEGIFELMRRGFDRWSFAREGQLERELEARGVLDKEVLPYYPYRDDAVPLYNTIKKYVDRVVRHHYDTPQKLIDDWELKAWRDELAKPRDQVGVGLKDLPGSDETGFSSVDEVVEVVTSIISTCSLGHAAANFQQYEQYGFVPNYPGILFGEIPKEKREYSEADLMAMLPNKRMTLDIMVITKLLSKRGTNSLGDFEMQYLYDPVGVQAAQEFQKDLKKISLEMKHRNIDRQWEFNWLDPEIVPNSISV